MVEDWKAFATTLSGDLRHLRADAPDVMKAFGALAQSALAGDGLEAKTKELIALAISVYPSVVGHLALNADSLDKCRKSGSMIVSTYEKRTLTRWP